jgi:hypothetical protein
MIKLLLSFMVVLGAEVAAAGRYLQQTEGSPLLPSTPFTTAAAPILIDAPLAESRKKLNALNFYFFFIFSLPCGLPSVFKNYYCLSQLLQSSQLRHALQ